jgi:hypothetical protein
LLYHGVSVWRSAACAPRDKLFAHPQFSHYPLRNLSFVAGFGAVVTFNNATFRGNRASNAGGGLSIKTRANATLQLSALVGNSAYRGGALVVEDAVSSVLLEGSRVSGAHHLSGNLQ